MKGKIFVCTWVFVGWSDISFGIHVCLKELYLDLHLPFGWLRVGFENEPVSLPINWRQCDEAWSGLHNMRRLIRAARTP